MFDETSESTAVNVENVLSAVCVASSFSHSQNFRSPVIIKQFLKAIANKRKGKSCILTDSR